jgi:hypothetical protein
MTEQNSDIVKMSGSQKYTISSGIQKELAARYASLFMLCYQRKDISGMHITLTACTHTLHALSLWSLKRSFMEDLRHYILLASFPEDELKALDWLLHHYFEQLNSVDESALLNWYQSLDDEWILRKKLRSLFPEKQNSELTVLIAAEKNKVGE